LKIENLRAGDVVIYPEIDEAPWMVIGVERDRVRWLCLYSGEMGTHRVNCLNELRANDAVQRGRRRYRGPSQ